MDKVGNVAPHTGAWIETSKIAITVCRLVVAPHTGAWIETLIIKDAKTDFSSHPTRVRGLKQHCVWWSVVCRVAPHTGAWIETSASTVSSITGLSHPTRVRGLKRKLLRGSIGKPVAPHTGAWIETKQANYYGVKNGRTPHGCVD